MPVQREIKGCEFYDDKRCRDTKRYLELRILGLADKDLTNQRENLCCGINPQCTNRTELLDNCMETL